jgi:hypothetical protein
METPGPAPAGYVWMPRPGRPGQWDLCINTRDVCWRIAHDDSVQTWGARAAMRWDDGVPVM